MQIAKFNNLGHGQIVSNQVIGIYIAGYSFITFLQAHRFYKFIVILKASLLIVNHLFSVL